MTAPRKFLFLQGVATPFFKQLANAIQQQGHQVFRVNFCGGDRLLAGRETIWRFNQPLSQLPEWLQTKHRHYHFTDVILFGDTRPVHTAAIAFFKQQATRIHVYEEGYLRPNWITLEDNGVNGYSSLMQDVFNASTQQEKLGAEREANAQKPHKTFGARALYDIAYRLANGLLWPWYHHYQSHRPLPAYREYFGWFQRFPANWFYHERRESAFLQQLIAQQQAYYLFPLQLDSDAQIRVHSPFASMQQVIQQVMQSFAQYAPEDCVLLIKNHPLDTGVLKHADYVKHMAQSLNIEKRVFFLETGDLGHLLKKAKGMVLVNSTSASSALQQGCPLIALGQAIFNRPGLTFQHGLDRFWTEAQPADPALYQRFRHILIAQSQINGDFYSRHGMQLAVEGSLTAMQIQSANSNNQDKASNPAIATLAEDFLPAPSYGGGLTKHQYLDKERQ